MERRSSACVFPRLQFRVQTLYTRFHAEIDPQPHTHVNARKYGKGDRQLPELESVPARQQRAGIKYRREAKKVQPRRLQQRNPFAFEQQARRGESKADHGRRAGVLRIIVNRHLRIFTCNPDHECDQHGNNIADPRAQRAPRKYFFQRLSHVFFLLYREFF